MHHIFTITTADSSKKALRCRNMSPLSLPLPPSFVVSSVKKQVMSFLAKKTLRVILDSSRAVAKQTHPRLKRDMRRWQHPHSVYDMAKLIRQRKRDLHRSKTQGYLQVFNKLTDTHCSCIVSENPVGDLFVQRPLQLSRLVLMKKKKHRKTEENLTLQDPLANEVEETYSSVALDRVHHVTVVDVKADVRGTLKVGVCTVEEFYL
ncbi:hypothetical protein Pelo_6516 [Pelomyxa schiedti]|nr:hypothetical protein Pelo_6516 [Pelomyxa schiedti]